MDDDSPEILREVAQRRLAMESPPLDHIAFVRPASHAAADRGHRPEETRARLSERVLVAAVGTGVR